MDSKQIFFDGLGDIAKDLPEGVSLKVNVELKRGEEKETPTPEEQNAQSDRPSLSIPSLPKLRKIDLPINTLLLITVGALAVWRLSESTNLVALTTPTPPPAQSEGEKKQEPPQKGVKISEALIREGKDLYTEDRVGEWVVTSDLDDSRTYYKNGNPVQGVHGAVDFAHVKGKTLGHPTKLPFNATVTFVSTKLCGLGAKATYGDGYSAVFCHFDNFQIPGTGKTKSVPKKTFEIKAGAVIGYVGETGRGSGPHLHYAFRKNGNAMKVTDKHARRILD